MDEWKLVGYIRVKNIMNNTTLLFNLVKEYVDRLNDVKVEDFIESKSFVIDCSKLPEPLEEGNIYEHEDFIKLFDDLDKIKSHPCVYWFELEDAEQGDMIWDGIVANSKSYKDEISQKIDRLKRKFRLLPAVKKKTSLNLRTHVLYVGKTKRDLKGRLVPHLGYYHNSPDTQGLQLCWWAKKMELKITFHYIELPDMLRDFTRLFEANLAKELKPLLGKHSN
jgi:hypothetical protein